MDATQLCLEEFPDQKPLPQRSVSSYLDTLSKDDPGQARYRRALLAYNSPAALIDLFLSDIPGLRSSTAFAQSFELSQVFRRSQAGHLCLFFSYHDQAVWPCTVKVSAWDFTVQSQTALSTFKITSLCGLMLGSRSSRFSAVKHLPTPLLYGSFSVFLDDHTLDFAAQDELAFYELVLSFSWRIYVTSKQCVPLMKGEV